MRRKLVTVALGVVMAVTGLVATSAPAQAKSDIPPGWSLWTKEYCQDGRLVWWRRLQSGNQVQGRLYIHQRGGRYCAFVVDRLPGRHMMYVRATVPGRGNANDYGVFDNYAGAIASPKNPAQFMAGGELQAKGRTFDRTSPVFKR